MKALSYWITDDSHEDIKEAERLELPIPQAEYKEKEVHFNPDKVAFFRRSNDNKYIILNFGENIELDILFDQKIWDDLTAKYSM